jgi:hypothetical protein
MAEQFIKAYAIREEALYGLVGSKDRRAAKRVSEAAEESDLGELMEEADLEVDEVVEQIVAGRLRRENAYGYRRLLEAVAAVLGRTLRPDEVVMPGRGWQELGPAWRGWGQKQLAASWGGSWSGNRELPWPWKRGPQVDWPVAILVPRRRLKDLRAELTTFATRVVLDRGVPAAIDRFGDEEAWPLDELAGEVAHVHQGLLAWVDAAVKARRDLLLLHDGQQ